MLRHPLTPLHAVARIHWQALRLWWKRVPVRHRLNIVPGGHLPSLGAIARALEGHSALGIESMENIAMHYAETLRRWRTALLERRRDVLDMGFGSDFFRRREYYFAYCEAAFASRILSDLQLVLARPGNCELGTAPYAGSPA